MKKLTSNFNSVKFIRTLFSIIAIAALTTVMVCAYSVVKPTGGDYYICASSDTSYCLDVTGGSTSPQAYIQLWQKTSNNAAQIFTLKHYSGDWYRIVNKNTGHIINVPGANSANGQRLWMWTNDDYTNASLWRFLNAGNGNYIIQNKMGRVIDLDNNLRFSGSRVHLWDEHGGASCRWKLVSASSSSNKQAFGNEINSINGFSSTRSSITQGTYKITLHDDRNYCLNVLYKSTETMTSLVGVDNFNSETNELFVIMHRGSNYYSIHPKHASYLCLNAKYANKTPGDALTLYTYENGDNASLWSFHKYADGSYAIKNKATGLVIDITDGSYYCGNKAINWTPNDYKRAQAYWFSLVSYDTKLDNKQDKYYSQLTNMKNGSSYNGTYKEKTRYTGPYASEQCKGFAKSVFEKLFGYNIGSTSKVSGQNYKIDIKTSKTAVVGSVSRLTASNAKSMFANARPGDFVQMRRHHSGSHSAIVYSVSSSGVTFYEANLDGANGIVVRTYTWKQLADDNSSMSVYTAKNR